MLAILFGLTAAFFFAAHYVAVRLGIRTSNPMSATLVSSLVNALFLWVVSILFLPFDLFLNKGMIYLAIAGLLAPCLARVFMYTGIEKVGVSITSCIKETAQFFAAFVAIVFLSETLTVSIALATVMTVFGVILLSRSSGASKTAGQFQWERKDLIYPFGAAVLYGISRVFRRLGMITVTSSWGGATIMATISLLFFLVLLAGMRNKQKPEINKNCLGYFALGGVFGGLGQVATLAAFKLGDVVLVGPVVSSTPLFSLLLNFIFLKKFESVTVHILGGAVLIVLAVAILTVMQ